MATESDDKTRVVMTVAVVLWISALALVFLSMRLRMKPMFLVGFLDVMLALFVTTLAVRMSRQKKLRKARQVRVDSDR